MKYLQCQSQILLPSDTVVVMEKRPSLFAFSLVRHRERLVMASPKQRTTSWFHSTMSKIFQVTANGHFSALTMAYPKYLFQAQLHEAQMEHGWCRNDSLFMGKDTFLHFPPFFASLHREIAILGIAGAPAIQDSRML